MDDFSKVIVVGRKASGDPVVKAKVPIMGANPSGPSILVPDFQGTSSEAYSLAQRLAEKIGPGQPLEAVNGISRGGGETM